MSNIPRMAEALRAIRENGGARRVTVGRECEWVAGDAQFSRQIVRDLIDAERLTVDAGGDAVTIDASPNFAESDAHG